MSTRTIDWKSVGEMTGPSLKGEVFSILQKASFDVQNNEVDDPQLLSVIPRLAALIEDREELGSLQEAFSGLARSLGLWNYIDRSVADARDELAVEVANIPELGIVLHKEQMAALNILLSGQNLILSAPTSFGKSI